jgi:PAS domain S-box-containing protein
MVSDSDLGRTVSGHSTRAWRPDGRLFVLLYSVLLLAVGALIIGVRSLDIVWTLMMVPIFVATVLYARRVYLVLLALFALASAFVILLGRPEDPADSARTIAVFLVAVGLASELHFRLTRIREASRQALAESEQRFRSLATMAPVGVFEATPDGRVTFFNPQLQAVFGLDDQFYASQAWVERIHPEDRKAVLEEWGSAMRTGTDFSREFRALDTTGEARWIRMRSMVKRAPDGSVTGRTGTVEDLTEHYLAQAALTRARDDLEERVRERTASLTSVVGYLEQEIADRRRAEEHLRQSEQRFSKVFFTSPLPMVISSLVDGRTLDVNDSFVALVGYAREELIGHSLVDVALWQRPSDRARVTGILTEHGSVRSFETELRTESGASLTVLISAEKVTIGGEQCVLAIATDITERAGFERDLQAFAVAQADLLDRQSESREQERRRLSEGVADGPLRALDASLVSLDRLEHSIERDALEASGGELHALRSNLKAADSDLRALVSSLSGHDLKEHGLGIALHAYAEQFSALSDMRIAVECAVQYRLPGNLELLMFRAAQDVLSYAREEAGATHVLVRVERDGSGIAMTVTHDGIQPSEIAHPPAPNPTIESWRRRCAALHGTLSVAVTQDQRTTLACRFPLLDD